MLCKYVIFSLCGHKQNRERNLREIEMSLFLVRDLKTKTKLGDKKLSEVKSIEDMHF